MSAFSKRPTKQTARLKQTNSHAVIKEAHSKYSPRQDALISRAKIDRTLQKRTIKHRKYKPAAPKH